MNKGELALHELAQKQAEIGAFLSQFAMRPLTADGTRMASPRFNSVVNRDMLLYQFVDMLNLQFDLEKPGAYVEGRDRYFWHIVTKHHKELMLSLIVLADSFVCNVRATGMEDPYGWTSLLRWSKAAK